MKRPPLILFSGLVLGLLGAALVMGYVRNVESRAGAAEEMTTVLVASSAIPTGTAADQAKGMATSAKVPARYARPGAIRDIEDVAGQFTVRRVEPGETLSARDFASAAKTAGALAIPAGREAVAVAVGIDGGVGRYPRPGDKVSVYATFKQGTALTQKILSDIQVLATQPAGSATGRLDAGSTDAAAAAGSQLVYLLAVTPDEATHLVHGKQTGDIWLTLVPEGQPSPPVAEVTNPAAITGGRS